MIPVGATVYGTINGVPHKGIVERIDPDDDFEPRFYLTDGYSILVKNVQSWKIREGANVKYVSRGGDIVNEYVPIDANKLAPGDVLVNLGTVKGVHKIGVWELVTIAVQKPDLSTGLYVMTVDHRLWHEGAEVLIEAKGRT